MAQSMPAARALLRTHTSRGSELSTSEIRVHDVQWGYRKSNAGECTRTPRELVQISVAPVANTRGFGGLVIE